MSSRGLWYRVLVARYGVTYKMGNGAACTLSWVDKWLRDILLCNRFILVRWVSFVGVGVGVG